MPYSYPTTPGVTYAVECAGEVIITNTETGAIAAQGDGSGQVLFTACANSYTVSDDTANVVALFKLAPRQKLTLLQGVAGGWLPKGFTELEYLESSGSQYIDTRIVPQTDTRLFIDCERLATLAGVNSIFGCRNTVSGVTNYYDAYFSNNPPETVGFRPYKQLTFNFPSGRFTAAFTGSTVEITGNEPTSYSPKGTVETSNSLYLLSINYGTGRISQLSVFKVYEFVLASPERTLLNLVPVLDADGVPCMYDKASKTCFYNSGTGTFGYRIKRKGETVSPMSLRDPWRVAPSGVYARPVGENALEIIADTEDTTGEGWEWFANTAEAYEHFGIVPQEEELLT